MRHRTASVEQARCGEGEVGVGGFHQAVAVVELAADLEIGFAACAEGAQFAALVVEVGGANRQTAGAFDQATVVGEIAAKANVDEAAADLAGRVVHRAGDDVHLAAGIDAAAAVVEGVAAGVEQDVAAVGGDAPAVAVDAAQCTQVEATAFDLA